MVLDGERLSKEKKKGRDVLLVLPTVSFPFKVANFKVQATEQNDKKPLASSCIASGNKAPLGEPRLSLRRLRVPFKALSKPRPGTKRQGREAKRPKAAERSSGVRKVTVGDTRVYTALFFYFSTKYEYSHINSI